MERDTFHVYLKDRQLHLRIYRDGYGLTTIRGNYLERPLEVIKAESAEEFEADKLVPSKRAYPERCDFELCKLLQNKGAEISFTSWTDLPEELQNRQFHGRLIEENYIEQK